MGGNKVNTTGAGVVVWVTTGTPGCPGGGGVGVVVLIVVAG